MRMTLNQIGNAPKIAEPTLLPLGCIIKPIQNDGPEERAIGCASGKLVRCSHCNAYMNPFARFCKKGHGWICNFCFKENAVSPEYFCGFDAVGRRYDVAQRPELSNGLVEWDAPPEFSKRPAQQPNYLFVIDVSCHAIQSGLVAMWFSAIQEILSQITDPRVSVGFITFNRTVQFYHHKPGSNNLRVTIAHQLEQVGSPVPSGILCNLQQERPVLQKIMDHIQASESQNPVGASCNGAAMMAAASVLHHVGGKVVCFVASGASCGPGTAKPRNEKMLLGTDKEKTLYQPQDAFWRRLALACVKRFVSVDIFAVNTPIDMSSMSLVSKMTGGQLYYNPKAGEHYRNTVMMNLRRNMMRKQGWEAVMRIRVSEGLAISDYYGNFNMWTEDDMEIVAIDCDKAVAVQFKYTKDLLNKPVSVQAALLYTNQHGERKIRVLTQHLTITSQLANVFRGADVDAIMNFSLRMCLQSCITSTIQAARDVVLKRTIHSLHAYRTSCAQSNSLAQLILPESLKLLPLYSLGLMKTTLLRKGTDVSIDDRAFLIAAFNSMPIVTVIRYMYPMLVPLHNCDQIENCGTILEDQVTMVMPGFVSTSSEKLESEGVYLLDTGLALYIWVGRHTSVSVLNGIFGVMSFNDINTSSFPLLDTKLSQTVNRILNYVQEQGQFWRPVEVLKDKQAGESKLYASLVEDKSAPGYNYSYVEFLCHIHTQIQNKMKR